MILYRSVHSLALGMKNKVQIDIPLETTRDAVNVVYLSSMNDRTRADLKTLSAILDLYEPTRIEGVRFKAKAGPQLAEKLRQVVQERLMDDDAYWELSLCGCSLGIPRLLRPALVDFSRLSRNLLHNPLFHPLYRAGTRLLQVAIKYGTGVKVPLPTSREFAELFEQQYFPPIGSLPVAVRFEDWIDSRLEQGEVRLGLPPSALPRMRSSTGVSSSKLSDIRQCSVCGETKLRDEFHDDRLLSGYGRKCRTCKAQRKPSTK
jgi:hypothetical protein